MKSIIIAMITILIIGGVFIYSSRQGEKIILNNDIKVNSDSTIISEDVIRTSASSSNVSVVDGFQIIELQVKGGYSPRKSVAQAGIPTIIRFNTSSTFDCSLSVRIPSINFNKILPQTGSTDVDIKTPSVGLFRGSCGMGMYPFEVDFQ